MVTKKSVTKKSIKKIEPKIKPVVKKSIPYKSEFKTIKLTLSEKIDLNWISIRRKIQAYNIWKLFKKEKIKTNKEKHKFNYPDLWKVYSDWFNKIFNKEKVKEDVIFRSDK